MKTHKNNKRPKKNGKKTRSKKQKGGTIFTPTTKEELKNAVMRWVDGDRDSLGNISEWNTSNITDMSNLFYELNDFNEDISRWDVSNVKNMEGMFNEAKAFNQPIGNWKVSNVTNMADMFNAAKAFNQPIGGWDVSNVKNMQYIFMSAITFNQPIGDWNVSSVIDMECMFYKAEAFNQPIGNWDVSNVTNMDGMFWIAKSFNQPIGDWDVSKVTNMTDMFNGANDFNQPIGNWDVSNVTKMRDMFNNSGYTHEQPSVESSKQRIQDKQNLDNLHKDVVSNTKKLNMSESTRKVLSLKPEQGPGIENIKEFLGGKKVKKKHSKKQKGGMTKEEWLASIGVELNNTKDVLNGFDNNSDSDSDSDDEEELEARRLFEEKLKAIKKARKEKKMKAKKEKNKAELEHKLIYNIEYKNDKGKDLNISGITIPKGTILFRKSMDINSDYCGYPNSENMYLIHTDTNVFFYFYPFYSDIIDATDDQMTNKMFYLTRDIQLLNLTNTSKFNKENRSDNDEPDVYTSCGDKHTGLKEYDPCLPNKFMKSYPDIMGFLAIADIDAGVHRKIYHNEPVYQNKSEKDEALFYSVLWEDEYNVGAPEVILHPFQKRIEEDYSEGGLVQSIDDCNKHPKNYELLEESSKENSIVSILNEYLRPEGKNNKHITIFSPLKLFVLYEELDDKYKKSCVPLIMDIKSKLQTFQKTDLYKDDMVPFHRVNVNPGTNETFNETIFKTRTKKQNAGKKGKKTRKNNKRPKKNGRKTHSKKKRSRKNRTNKKI